MPPTTRQRILPIEQLNTEWRTLGRSEGAVRALHRVAERDPTLSLLVHGSPPAGGSAAVPASCPTPWDLIEHMRRATDTRGRNEAAGLVRIMLREAEVDPLVVRCLMQALLPGLLTVASAAAVGTRGRLGRRRRVLQRDPLDDMDGPGRMVGAGPPLRRARPALGHPLPHAPSALPRPGPPATAGSSLRGHQGAWRRPLRDRSRSAGANTHRPTPGRHEGRRRRGALCTPRTGLLHRRAGTGHRSGPPIALRPARSGPASPVRLRSRPRARGVEPKVTPWVGTSPRMDRTPFARGRAARTGGSCSPCRSRSWPWSRRPRRLMSMLPPHRAAPAPSRQADGMGCITAAGRPPARRQPPARRAHRQ